MIHPRITLHESMELHEMLNLKTVSMTKAKLMQGLVFDQGLKALLDKSVKNSIPTIKDLQDLLANCEREH